VPKELEKLQVPALILQPLVENAIKHGISENKTGGLVRISARLETRKGSEFLNLEVFDSGRGLKPEKALNSAGVGLKNIRDRLTSYYGEKAGLEIKSDAKGTRAEIRFALAPDGKSLRAVKGL